MIPVKLLLHVLGVPESIVIERSGVSLTDELGNVTRSTALSPAEAAVVHPASRKQLERAGVDVTTDARAVYTAVPMAIGDVVRWRAERWEVVNLGDYGELGGLYLALASRCS